MTWRQHRLQWAATGAVLAALAVYLILDGIQRSDYADSIGLTACLAAHHSCDALANAFTDRFGPSLPSGFFLLDLLPLLAGLFWGAPLLAREVETGTHRLAWTQSVSRRRWLTVKIATFTAVGILAAAVVSLLSTWWLRLLQALSVAGQSPANRLSPIMFDLTGIVPIATTLFAFALGACGGALLRRTVPAMAVTSAVFMGVWLPVRSLRYYFLTPITATMPFGGGLPPSVAGSYPLATGQIDAAGHHVPFTDLLTACGTLHNGEFGLTQSSLHCLAAKGFGYFETYQPDRTYWPLQGIETGILLAAATALLALTVWWTHRKLS